MSALEELVESKELISYYILDSNNHLEYDKQSRLLLVFPSGRQLEVNAHNNEVFILGTRTCSKCSNIAKWSYSPGDSTEVWCDACVPSRGCNCHHYYASELEEDPDLFQVILTDYDGREDPCVEYNSPIDQLL